MPVVVVLAPVGQACGRRARTAVPPRHQPACPLPCQRDALGDVAGAVPTRSTPSFFPSPSPLLSLTAPERCRRRHSPLPQPPSPPRLSDTRRSSASSLRSSPLSHASRGAPWSRRRRHLRLRPPWIPIAAPPTPALPRALQRRPLIRCEPPRQFPLLSCLPVLCSPQPLEPELRPPPRARFRRAPATPVSPACSR